jgi:hypothetical protein
MEKAAALLPGFRAAVQSGDAVKARSMLGELKVGLRGGNHDACGGESTAAGVHLTSRCDTAPALSSVHSFA